MALSERMAAAVERIGQENDAAGRPRRLTPEQQEEALTNSSIPEKIKRTLRRNIAAGDPGARLVVWSMWCRQHGVARTAEQVMADYAARNAGA